MKKQTFLIPIYGLREGLQNSIILEKGVLIRNIDLLGKEYKTFRNYGLKANYHAVLEIDYQYDSNDASEPYPGISINVINKVDSALLVFGEGNVGTAAILPKSKTSGYTGFILSNARPRYEECLDKKLDKDFVDFYKKFLKAYELRPLAFDIYRRSRDRFANNDRTIDSCTVLESIFVPLGEKSKKPFILSGMKILGFSNKEVGIINDLVEYRNAIIHADRNKQLKFLSGSRYTHVWFETAFKLIRDILYKFVEHPWN